MSILIDCPITNHRWVLHKDWGYVVYYQCEGCGCMRQEYK